MIYGIIGLIIGFIVCFLIIKPKLKKVKSLNQTVTVQNEELIATHDKLSKTLNELDTSLKQQTNEYKELLIKKESLISSIGDLRRQAEESSQAIYDKTYDYMQEKLSAAAHKLSKQFDTEKEKYEKDYLKVLEECSFDISSQLEEKLEELAEVQEKLNNLQAKTNAAIEAAKREEEKLLELDKYKLCISDADLLEINRLREIAPYFRNARPIYKIIWEGYYRNNTTDLINRVIGTGTHTGIYKITNLLNQKIYIGQSSNLSNRWKDHIKAGLGIDTPNNMLYIAMLKDGVENFSFEVLEECEQSALNNRETYWIEFYQSQYHGYNMTKGGARSN